MSRNKFAVKLLNLEISDTFYHYRRLKYNINQFIRKRNIINKLPFNIYDEFFHSQDYSLHRLRVAERKRMLNKIKWLESKDNNQIIILYNFILQHYGLLSSYSITLKRTQYQS